MGRLKLMIIMMSSARSAPNQGNFTSKAINETVHSSRIAQFHNISADDNYLSHELMSNKSQWILFGMPLEITFTKVNHFIGFVEKCWCCYIAVECCMMWPHGRRK